VGGGADLVVRLRIRGKLMTAPWRSCSHVAASLGFAGRTVIIALLPANAC